MDMTEEKLKPPVKVGNVLNLVVIGFGKNKDPILKADKYVLFLKLAEGVKVKKGEEVQIKVTRILPNFGFAEMI